MAGLHVPLSNASPTPLRTTAHDSGSGWIATPSLYGSYIRDSLPVYPGAHFFNTSLRGSCVVKKCLPRATLRWTALRDIS
jgi:hypothetical protein